MTLVFTLTVLAVVAVLTTNRVAFNSLRHFSIVVTALFAGCYLLYTATSLQKLILKSRVALNTADSVNSKPKTRYSFKSTPKSKRNRHTLAEFDLESGPPTYMEKEKENETKISKPTSEIKEMKGSTIHLIKSNIDKSGDQPKATRAESERGLWRHSRSKANSFSKPGTPIKSRRKSRSETQKAAPNSNQPSTYPTVNRDGAEFTKLDPREILEKKVLRKIRIIKLVTIIVVPVIVIFVGIIGWSQLNDGGTYSADDNEENSEYSIGRDANNYVAMVVNCGCMYYVYGK
mmetsp:Transcript_20566/g.28909  ORF Transcript_20566/g.28909 Transcript_20566/m.28909 type:complete len:289 (-) Transcript_20566:259-1125(-)